MYVQHMEREKEPWPTSRYYGRIRYEELMKAAKTPHGQPAFQPRLVTGLCFRYRNTTSKKAKEINILSQNSIYLQPCLEISVNNMHTANVTVVVRC